MAIQLRRGDYADFDPSQLLDGELAVVLENDPATDDGTGTYVSYGDNNVKRLLTSDESVDVDVATWNTPGIVKPDGVTIYVDSEGEISCASASCADGDEPGYGVVWPDGVTLLLNNDYRLFVRTATTSQRGVVKPDGTSITVDADGTIHGSANVPIATTSTAGKVKPDGTTATIDNDGTLHAAGAPIATTETAGTVMPDGTSILVNEDGEIHVPEATFDSPGIVQPDNTTITVTEYGGYIQVPTATDESLGLVQPDGETTTVDSYGVLSVIGGGSSVTPSSTAPAMDGTASVGSSDAYARGDHVHPTDTSRAAASDLTSHTGNTTAHVTAAERTAWNAKASTDTATTSTNGLMSSADKTKLDGIESGANAYELPLMSPTTRGGAKVGHGLTVEGGALGIGEVTDPTDAGPIVALSAKGWAEQDTTTGKNLVVLGEGTWTYSGITFKTHTNASIEISGTATAEIGYASHSYLTHLPAGTYTLSGWTSDLQRLNVYKYANGSPTYIGSDMGSGYTFTLSEDTDVYVYPIVANGKTINTIIYPQLELGSTATSYEPYTGGAPSPSPSYPQEIKVCRGRNLLNESVFGSWTLQGSSIFSVDNDGTVTVLRLDNTSEQSESQFISLPAGTYTLSVDNMCRMQVAANRVKIVDTYSTTSVTFTLSESSETVHFKLINNSYPYSVGHIQLERGSQATPYVPYGCVGVDVWEMNLGDTIKNGVYAWATGNYDSANTSYVCTEKRPCVGGETYFVDMSYPTSSSGLMFWDKDGAFISAASGGTNMSYQKVAPSNAAYIAINICKSSSDSQISPSSINSLYIGHKTTIPIPLPSRGWVAALPDGTADTLVLDGAGGYTWELAVGGAEFDGSSDETWVVGGNYASTGGGHWRIDTSDGGTKSMYGRSYCNRLAYGNTGMSTDLTGMTIYGNTGAQIRIHPFTPDGQMTVEQITTWLSTHPVTVLYPLATPTTERGYVDSMPTVPVHAAISSADLVDIAVRCTADSGAAEIASAWGRRYESRIAALEEIVANLI